MEYATKINTIPADTQSNDLVFRDLLRHNAFDVKNAMETWMDAERFGCQIPNIHPKILKKGMKTVNNLGMTSVWTDEEVNTTIKHFAALAEVSLLKIKFAKIITKNN